MFWKNRKLALLSFTLLSTASLTAFAQPIDEHIVVAPQCLIQHSEQFTTLASTQKLRLLKTNAAGIDKLIEMRDQQKSPCGGFRDVTDIWNKEKISLNQANTFLSQYDKPERTSLAPQKANYTIRYEAQVNQLLNQLNSQNMWTNLTTLSDFHDRYAGSDNGVKAANWIKNQVETIAKNNGRNDVTAYFVSTGVFYKQPSLVVKVGTSSEPGVVVGGHMDTLSGMWEKKPGADDDGTGTVTVLEVARTVLSSGMHFKKPIYFIWYAAEEMGLVGSQHVVTDFKNKHIPVDAVLQMDMSGYAYQNQPTMWLIDDNVNKDLTAYLETLINTYVKQPVKHLSCGYDCSDHATWYHAGFPSCAPFESSFETDNPYIHSSQDTMEKLSLTHMTDYAKLLTAFTVEMAEPVA